MRRLAASLFLLPLLACTNNASTADAGPAAVDAGPCAFPSTTQDQAAAPAPHTPRWAFLPWISKDISDGADTDAFVDGFKSRDIPVGVVVVDSPWMTQYTTFLPSPSRYPNFGAHVARLRQQGIRTVLWTTAMVNEVSLDLEQGGDTYDGPSPNFDEGLVCNFYVNNGDTYLWWKGRGAGFDFSNEHGRAWFHRQQDAVLDMGVAGWKLDFGEEYVSTDTVQTASGPISHQAYSEAYYRDFLSYGVARNGAEEFLTMVRPWDRSYQFTGRFYARPEHAPVGWVGDNRRDWIGVADVLESVFRSANAGYAVLGSDIGGYLDVDDTNQLGPKIPFSTLVFARWTAMSALMPLMQLHGRANITPWTVPDHVDETVAMYRQWSMFHTALVPFFFSLSQQAHAAGTSIIHPLGDEASWAGDFRYLLGDAFLVAPLLDDSGSRSVALPAGSRWLDWWHQDAAPLAGGSTFQVTNMPREQFPFFLKEGALVPLDVKNDVNGLGTNNSSGHLTLVAWPAPTASSFALHEEEGSVTNIQASITNNVVNVTLSQALRPLLARIYLDTRATSVMNGTTAISFVQSRSELDNATSGAWWESEHILWVKVPSNPAGITLQLQ